MRKPYNYLRKYRRQASLTQIDVAYVLGLNDYMPVSRWENGHRVPDIDTLLTYNMLFNTSIETFFELQKEDMKPVVAGRLASYIEHLATQDEPNVSERLTTLKGALTRLTATCAHVL